MDSSHEISPVLMQKLWPPFHTQGGECHESKQLSIKLYVKNVADSKVICISNFSSLQRLSSSGYATILTRGGCVIFMKELNQRPD